MRRDKWTPSKYERICENHFLPGDYNLPPTLGKYITGNRHLKTEAVPSVFNFPEHLKSSVKTTRLSPKRCSTEQSVAPSLPAKSTKLQNESKNSVQLDHSYPCKTSPRKLCAQYRKKIMQKDYRLKQLRKKKMRLEKNVRGLVSKLEAASVLSNQLSTTLIENFGHITTELIRNEAKNITKSCGSRYGDEIKEFALTLHFHSPKAYRFVRKSLHLPHPTTLRSWCVNINCEPGFLSKPLNYIEQKVAEDQQDCVILIDAMAIRKQIQWDRKTNTFVGRVDYGGIQAENLETEATNALVFMATGLQKPWCVPVAYFLTHSLNGDILKELILEAIKKISEEGAYVHAIVFDGAPENLSMAAKLGCSIKELDGSFDYPGKPGERIHVILDVCHMIKLARNAFADLKVFCTPTGEKISWEFVKALYRTQQKDILHLGNKLKTKHIQWYNYKMKVSVAAQTLSHSVSAAITFLRNLKLQEFKDSRATSDFILLMNNIFDILNSKSKFGKNYKAPITIDNFLGIEGHIQNAIEVLKSLKDEKGIFLKDGPRRVFVIGFCISSQSILEISRKLLNRSSKPFNYILTYRFSQDQLEMYFAKIRSRFGWNNNPTTLQLKYAIRQLLLRNKIESPSTANCIAVSNMRESDLSKVDPRVSDLLLTTNIWRSDVIHYISGYIVKKLFDSISCHECAAALCEDSETSKFHSYEGNLTLLACKRYGNLIVPSHSVCRVVSCVDRKARQALCKWATISNEINRKIQFEVIHEMKNITFQSISDHSRENHIIDLNLRDDHITIIIREIVKQYLLLFYHQFGRVFTERVLKRNRSSMRQKLTKQILFQHD